MDENGTEIVLTLPEEVVHSTAAQNYPFQRTKIVDFSSDFQAQPTEAQLRAAAQSYIQNNDVGNPKVSLDFSFIALHQTQEYADLTKIEHINLCDIPVLFTGDRDFFVVRQAAYVSICWKV